MKYQGSVRLFISALSLCAVLASAQQYTSLFNGQNLDGWTVNGKGSWKVQNGEIVATQPASEPDFTHLIYNAPVGDFEITFLFKNPKGNTGFFFRFEQTAPGPAGVTGVQAVIDATKKDDNAFGFYETNGREWLKKWSYATWNPIFIGTDWNRITIVAEGTRLLLKLNMRTIVDIVDPTGRKQGKIAFKLHGGRDEEAHFKDIRMRPVYHGLKRPFLKSRLKKTMVYGETNTSKDLRAYLKQMANEQGFAMDESRNTDFTKANLANYQAALFLADNEISLNDQQRKDFEEWFRQGNGSSCIAACARKQIGATWPWWGEAIGQSLNGQTESRSGTARVDADGKTHPITRNLDPGPWGWTEGWSYYADNPRKNKSNTVLVLADKDNFKGNAGDTFAEYPLGWIHESQGGKMFHYGAFNTFDGLNAPFHYDFLLNAIQYIAGYDTVKTGCMNPAFAEFNPYATVSEPAACQTTGIEGASRSIEKSIRIRGRRFSVSLKGDYTVRITDARGRLLQQSSRNGESEYDLSSVYGPGIVYLSIRTGNSTVTKRLMLL
jgi:hypothetical protein